MRALTQLVKSASIYYVKPRPTATGERAACSFPAGQIRTHLAPSCCDPAVAGADGMCDPKKIEWNRTLWSALKWKLDEPHAFIYAYEGSGSLGEARFTASAYGDLDCDGVYSTFRFTGRGSAASKADDCILTETATFEAIQPGE
ncbi:MAG: hypothetical protein HY902_14705 [Deltaproteobacteria bacterium]|nr:hypothetical protein [Deltaproteobacteria bacterium]